MKIAVASDVLVRAVLRDDETQSLAAEQVLKEAELIAVSIPSMCEFVDILTRTHALEPDAVAEAVRSLLNASNVVADRPALAMGLAMLGNGGTFSKGVAALEGYRFGADRFVSFDADSVLRFERMIPHYREPAKGNVKEHNHVGGNSADLARRRSGPRFRDR